MPKPITANYSPPPDTGLDILYLDDDLVVLNKPSGLLSVPGRGMDKQDSLAVRVQREYGDALVVHRLDMSTSGLILMARGQAMQSVLGRLFQQRKVEKRYIAVVGGQPRPAEGEIDLPLITDWPNRPRQMVDHQQGKPALTRYEVLEHDALRNTSRVLLQPHTGRSHQLRVHMMALGHPILGDELYAPRELQQASDRLLLHAQWLRLPHPRSGERVSIQCDPVF